MRILFTLLFSILFVSCSSDNKSERKQINEILAKGEKITNYENLSLEDSKEISQKNSIKFSKFNKYKNWTHTNYNYTSNIGIRNFNLNYQLPTYIQAKVDDKLKFMKFCNANNIEIHLGLNTISNNLSHDIKKNTKLNNSISLCSILVRLPSGPGYKKSEIIQICKQLNKY